MAATSRAAPRNRAFFDGVAATEAARIARGQETVRLPA
jgi:hypothetical protein